MQEIPCRDTDPITKEEESARESPVAFTIDFGFADNSQDRAAKFERFALRSSLRKPQSPRQLHHSEAASMDRYHSDQHTKGSTQSISGKFPLTNSRVETGGSSFSEGKQSPLAMRRGLAERRSAGRGRDSSLSRQNELDSAILSPTGDVTGSKMAGKQGCPTAGDRWNGPTNVQQQIGDTCERKQSGGSLYRVGKFKQDRRKTHTLSPEESSLFKYTEKIEDKEETLEIYEDYQHEPDYLGDDGLPVEVKEDRVVNGHGQEEAESAASETGTYTVDKEEESQENDRSELNLLLDSEMNKSDYVHEWASRHAHLDSSRHPGGLRPAGAQPSSEPETPQDEQVGVSLQDAINQSSAGMEFSSLGSTRPSLTKSRRKLPTVPVASNANQKKNSLLGLDQNSLLHMLGESQAECSPTTPTQSPLQESFEGESGYIKHTQHLLNIMEDKISKSKLHAKSSSRKKLLKSSHSSLTTRSNTSLSNLDSGGARDARDAREAWERRKNYDPLAASGRKKERKLSSKSEKRNKNPDSSYEDQGEEVFPDDLPQVDPQLTVEVNSPEDYSEDSKSSLPNSARSSHSSGYFSRGEEKPVKTIGGRSHSKSAGTAKAGRTAARPVTTRSSTAPISSSFGAKRTGSLATGLAGRSGDLGQRHQLEGQLNKHSKLTEIKSNSGTVGPAGDANGGNRSCSSLTAKEAEFQAWKRRKNYDPLKAARKSAGGGGNSSSQKSLIATATNGSASSSSANNGASSSAWRIHSAPSTTEKTTTSSSRSSLLGSGSSRSAGHRFHGTEEMGGGHQRHTNGQLISGIPTHKRVMEMTQSLHQDNSSDDGGPIQRSASFHYENAARAASTTSAAATVATNRQRHHHHHRQQQQRQATSEEESADDYGSGCDSSLGGGDSSSLGGPTRQYYLDEDELILPIYPSASPAASAASHRQGFGSKSLSPARSKGSRLEALDNLVISTIFNVSSKLCKSTATLLRKAGTNGNMDDEDQVTTIETVLYLLEDIDLPASPAKKTSRELSGTLRNLKKVEQALEMMHKIVDSTDSEES